MNDLELEKEIETISGKAVELKITNDAELEISKRERNLIKSVIEKIGEFCDPGIAKAHELHKELLSKKKSLTIKPLAADEIIKGKQTEYLKEVERKRTEEQEKIRKEFEAKQLAEKIKREQELEQAIKEGNTEKAEIIIEQPAPKTPTIKFDKPSYSGAGLVNNYKMRIVDASLVPREYCCPDEKMLAALAKSSQGKAIVPGVEFYNEQTVRQSR